MIEYTPKEKKIMIILFEMLKKIMEAQNGYMEIDYETFDSNDLFCLADRLGIEDY